MISASRAIRTVVAIAALVAAPSCSGQGTQPGSESEAGTEAGPTCVPGLSVGCNGAAGCKGYQVCRPDGSGFSVCDCSGEDAGSMDASSDSTMGHEDATADVGSSETSVNDSSAGDAADAAGSRDGSGGADSAPDAVEDVTLDAIDETAADAAADTQLDAMEDAEADGSAPTGGYCTSFSHPSEDQYCGWGFTCVFTTHGLVCRTGPPSGTACGVIYCALGCSCADAGASTCACP